MNGNSNFKSIVLVPGFQATQSSITNWAKYLASRGFICLTIGTNSLFDNPYLRAAALIDGMETIRQENNRMSSPVYQKIDTGNIAVGGWSMGGGGAQLAAKLEPRIKAVLAIAPWLNQGTLSASDLNHTSPVLIISGQIDPVAPPIFHSDMHYNYTPNTTHKLLFEILGGDHYTPLEPSTGNGDAGNIAYAWLQMYLNTDDCYCRMLGLDSLNQNATASKYLTNLVCAPLSTTTIAKLDLNVRLFPNPVSDEFLIQFSNQNQLEYSIHTISGQQMKYGKVRSGDKIKIEGFANGTYFLILEQQVFKLLKN
jgi:dienelactone hydrolase